MNEYKKVGFMQGRLSPIINNRIQMFPVDNWKDEFVIAERIGLHKIEWTLDLDTLEYNPLLKKKGRDEINKLAVKYNINIPSLTCDYLMQKPFWKLEAERDKIIEQFYKIIESCYELGISIIVVPLVDNGNIENKDEEDYLVRFFEKNIKKFEIYNIKVIFESDYSPNSLLKFINRFDSSIGINYDTGNSASLGYSPSEEIGAYGDRIINVHIKDRKYKGTTVPLLDGDCNFTQVFESLKKIGYNKNYILQTARCSNNKHSDVITKYAKLTQQWINSAK